MPKTLQLTIPFDIFGASDEQDSLEEIAASVEMILRSPLGHYLHNSDLGVRDLVFQPMTDALLTQIKRAIVRWEPRAIVEIEERPERFDAMIRRIVIDIQGNSNA